MKENLPYILSCLAMFMFTYTLNMIYVSVFYHRALTHSSLTLTPWLRTFVVYSGSWITGLDPKGWACMHRLHHAHSDTSEDPHSPIPNGVMSVLYAQLRSYKKILKGLILGKPQYTAVVKDLNFEVNWLNRHKLWILPYLLHMVVAVAIGYFFNAWLLAGCYWFGMMSHPIQGWMVNAFAHRFGYRNFPTPDNSRNNTLVAWLVFGEGFQNNHHQNPASASFSYKWWEVDFGYGLCLALSKLGLLKFTKQS